jgi:hypothetical protein
MARGGNQVNAYRLSHGQGQWSDPCNPDAGTGVFRMDKTEAINRIKKAFPVMGSAGKHLPPRAT